MFSDEPTVLVESLQQMLGLVFALGKGNAHIKEFLGLKRQRETPLICIVVALSPGVRYLYASYEKNEREVAKEAHLKRKPSD